MKNLKLILLFLFVISTTFKTHAYDGHEENLGREGPPPAGPYKLGFKELERAIKTEKKGKIKKAKIKFEKALDYFGDRITPSNNIYYSYFKALALKAIGRADEANGIFEYIANFNFLGWEPGLTRNLSINELKS